jgi:hypothetical protein
MQNSSIIDAYVKKVENDMPRIKPEYLHVFESKEGDKFDKVHDSFNEKIVTGIGNCYLARSIRVLEGIARKKFGRLFILECSPFPETELKPNMGAGFGGFFKDLVYRISYNPNLEEEQLRSCIAHELGHFCGILFHGCTDRTKSSVYAEFYEFFILLNRDYHYTYGVKKKTANWKRLIDECKLMKDHKYGSVK